MFVDDDPLGGFSYTRFKEQLERIPLKGWELAGIEDLDEPDGTCELCGTKIRYVHEIKHVLPPKSLNVGCCCCVRLTEDEFAPKEFEKLIKAHARKKTQFKKKPKIKFKNPKTSFLKVGNLSFILYETKPGLYNFCYKDKWYNFCKPMDVILDEAWKIYTETVKYKWRNDVNKPLYEE